MSHVVLAGSEHLKYSVSGFVLLPGVAEEKSGIYADAQQIMECLIRCLTYLKNLLINNSIC